MSEDAELFASLSERLRIAQQRLAGQPADRQKSLQDRLIVITNSSKHDLATASRRLDALLAEIDQTP